MIDNRDHTLASNVAKTTDDKDHDNFESHPIETSSIQEDEDLIHKLEENEELQALIEDLRKKRNGSDELDKGAESSQTPEGEVMLDTSYCASSEEESEEENEEIWYGEEGEVLFSGGSKKLFRKKIRTALAANPASIEIRTASATNLASISKPTNRNDGGKLTQS